MGEYADISYYARLKYLYLSCFRGLEGRYSVDVHLQSNCVMLPELRARVLERVSSNYDRCGGKDN